MIFESKDKHDSLVYLIDIKQTMKISKSKAIQICYYGNTEDSILIYDNPMDLETDYIAIKQAWKEMHEQLEEEFLC